MLPKPNDKLLQTSRWIARAAILLNGLFAAAVLLGLLLSFLAPNLFAAVMLLKPHGPEAAAKLVGLRWTLLLGAAIAVPAALLLAALAQILRSTAAGDPFLAINARRIQTIGWALLALQLLELPAAWIARSFPLGAAAPEGSVSPAGWLAVLMAFVLSRVFAAGSRMRDDLEGTV